MKLQISLGYGAGTHIWSSQNRIVVNVLTYDTIWYCDSNRHFARPYVRTFLPLRDRGIRGIKEGLSPTRSR